MSHAIASHCAGENEESCGLGLSTELKGVGGGLSKSLAHPLAQLLAHLGISSLIQTESEGVSITTPRRYGKLITRRCCRVERRRVKTLRLLHMGYPV
jgi:hypothetical protein